MSKKFLIIGSTALSLINFRMHLMLKIQQRGYDIYAIGPEDKQVAETLQAHGIHYHAIKLDRHSISVLSNIRYFISLIRLIKEIKPNVLLAYTIKPIIYGLIAGKLVGIKRQIALISGLGYCFTATSTKAKLLKIPTKRMYQFALRYADKIIFQNPDDRDLFTKQNLVKENKTMVVNGSGVDLMHYKQEEVPQEIVFLMITRLLPEKGVWEYIAACKKIKERYPHIKCQLAGYIDGTLTNIEEKHITDWKNNNIIDFLGRLDDVRTAIKNCSVFVLPSYREGTPRSVLEAMSIGRAIITTDEPGCRETVINNHNGFLIPSKNHMALYESMLKFIQDTSLGNIMGIKSREIAEKKYCADNVSTLITIECLGETCHAD